MYEYLLLNKKAHLKSSLGDSLKKPILSVAQAASATRKIIQ
jgi:hypothetical protein